MQAPPPAVRTDILLQDINKHVLQLLGDSVEMNREATVGFIARFVEADEAGCPRLLAFLVPALASRIGKTPFPEDAEEIRLQLAQMLNGFLVKPSCFATIRQCFTAIADILRCLASDAFHSVKVEAASAASHLASATPDRIHLALQPLVTALVANLGHQRGPVRLASLSALHRILPLGGESLSRVMNEVALPALRALRFDRTPSVRRQLAVTTSQLLQSLPSDVLSSTEHHLVALQLTLMADETMEVGEQALASYEAAAAVRRQQLEAGSAESQPRGQPSDGSALSADLAVAAAAAAPDASIAGYDEAAAVAQQMAVGLGHVPADAATAVPLIGSANAAAGAGPSSSSGLPRASLPQPFKKRPSVDAIWTSQRLLPSLTKLLLDGLQDWTVPVRHAAAGALRSLLVLVEDAVTAQLGPIIAALCTGSRDEDAEVRKVLGEVGRLVGAFAPPQAQLAVLLPQLRGEVSGLNNSQHYASALAVLGAAVSSMSQASLAPHLPALASTLALPSLADDEPAALKQQLAGAVAFTVRIGLVEDGKDAGGGGDVAAAGAPGDVESDGERTPAEPSSSDAPVLDRSAVQWPVGATPPLTASRSHLIPDAALDNLLRALLHLQDVNTSVEVAATAADTAKQLASALRYASVHHMYAARMSSLLPGITLGAGSTWSKGSHGRRVFDTLLRVSRPALCGRTIDEARSNVESIVHVFVETLSPSREPELRVAQLALLDAFICPSAAASPGEAALRGKPATHASSAAAVAGLHSSAATAGAGRAAADDGARAAFGSATPSSTAHSVSDALVDVILADNSGILLQHALLPNAVWRVGLVAATIRKVAIACMVSLGRLSLLPQHALQPAFAEALPTLKSCLADDDATTRHLTCLALQHMLAVLHRCLDYEMVRQLYPELLKRLDDSNDAVRLSGCAAIGQLCLTSRPEDLEGTPCQYTIDTLLIHMDDTDPSVQAAVFEALLPYVALDPVHGRKAVMAARDKHRHPGYCDRLVEHIDGFAAVRALATAHADGAEVGSDASSAADAGAAVGSATPDLR